MSNQSRRKRQRAREKDRSYWTPEAVMARRQAKEAQRAATLARESARQAEIEYNSVPFHNDDEELAYLIAQQEKDMKYGDRTRFRKQDGMELYSTEEFLDGELELWHD